MRELKKKLLGLMEERKLGNWERRRRRLLQAEANLRQDGKDFSDAIEKARNGNALSVDEFIVVHLGFLPGEIEELERSQQNELERLRQVQHQRTLQ